MKVLRSLLLTAALALATQVGTASATCGIYGDIHATQTRDGWLYCIDFSYTILDSLDQVSVFLPECAQGCDSGMIKFPTPAGTLSGVTGAGDTCTVELAGNFYCHGDPALNAPPVPTVTWTPTNADTCHATMPGVGHICFEMNVAPGAPREQTNAITILTGDGQCWGTLKGTLPGCNPPIPTQPVTWSDLKARYSH